MKEICGILTTNQISETLRGNKIANRLHCLMVCFRNIIKHHDALWWILFQHLPTLFTHITHQQQKWKSVSYYFCSVVLCTLSCWFNDNFALTFIEIQWLNKTDKHITKVGIAVCVIILQESSIIRFLIFYKAKGGRRLA